MKRMIASVILVVFLVGILFFPAFTGKRNFSEVDQDQLIYSSGVIPEEEVPPSNSPYSFKDVDENDHEFKEDLDNSPLEPGNYIDGERAGTISAGEDFGGGWFQSSDQDLSQCTLNSVTISGNGPEARVNLSSIDVEGWTEMDADPHPSARYGHDMAYSGEENQILLFGGYDGAYDSETWLYDVRTNTWSQVLPSPAPSGRYFHKMTYDSGNNKVVLFGGYYRRSDTWVYDVDANSWNLRSPDPHPPDLYQHALTYDSINAKVVLFGGRTRVGGWHPTNETWLYDVSENTWTKREPATSPPPRRLHDLAYDPVNNKVVLFGGYNESSYLNDTWVYDVDKNEWTEINTTSDPPLKGYHSMVWDRDINRVVLYGGYPYDSKVWLFNTFTNTWTSISYGENPPVRYSSAMAHDIVSRKSVVFGGIWNYMDDTWVYDQYHYSQTGKITSPVITLPEGYDWDRLSLDKNELRGTSINVTVINAITSTAIPGYIDISLHDMDISGLNSPEYSAIRLEALFRGTVDVTPTLYSWGVQWKREGGWYDDFAGGSNIMGAVGADDRTSSLWHFDGESGQMLTDSSNNGNDGLLGGGENVEPSDPRRVNSRFDGALSFDGEDDYIWVDRTESLKSFDALTVEAWFKMDKICHNTLAVLGGRADGDYSLQVLNNGTLRFLISTIDMNPDQYNEFYSRSIIKPGEWYHFAFTFDMPDMLFYLNGVEEARRTVDFPLRHSAVPLLIGAEVGSAHFPYNPTNFFCGIIDEIRISNISRQRDEIYAAARGGLSLDDGQAELIPNMPEPTTDTVLLYHFEEVRDGIVSDAGRNDIFALLNGAVETSIGKFGRGLRFYDGDEHMVIRDSHHLHLKNVTYEFWVKWEGTDGRSVLFYEEARLEGANEIGEIDPSGRVHFTLQNGTYDIASGDLVAENEWTHLAFVRAPGTAKIYMNGRESGSGSFSVFEHDNTNPLFIGGNSSRHGVFNGIIDEMVISRRALSGDEITRNADNYRRNAAFWSKVIAIPEWNGTLPGKIWNTFHMDCDMPVNTEMNVTIHDHASGELLVEANVSDGSVSGDLKMINVLEHRALHIRASISSQGVDTPSIHNWGVNWSGVETPRFTGNMSNELFVTEDTPISDLTDISDHFIDVYSGVANSTYSIKYISGRDNITLAMNGSRLDVIGIEDNWTGTASVIVNCTNVYSRSCATSPFDITVVNVEDAPVWLNSPAPIVLDEDENVTFPDFFKDIVFDAENEELGINVSSDNENISAEMVDEKGIAIAGARDYSGRGIVTAVVFEREDPSVNSSIVIPVRVKPVNDPPCAELVSPRNGTTITSEDVTFAWSSHDVDSPPENISFDFYLSKTYPPLVYLSDIRSMTISIDDLDDGSTYYWKVLPSDGIAAGISSNGTWRFNINTTILYPEVILTEPLNGSILNTTGFEIFWDGKNPTINDISYHVYLGTSLENMSKIGLVENTSYALKDLEDNTTHFWKVIPVAGDIEGPCKSGIWSFHINTSFIPIYDLKMEVEEETINITQGDNGSFAIYLTNLGNVPVVVMIHADGVLETYIEIETEVLLPAGTRVKVVGTIASKHTRVLSASNYRVPIRVSYLGGVKESDVIISILDPSGTGDGPREEPAETIWSGPGSDVFWLWILIGALVVVTLCFIIFVMKKKKEDKKREQERLELLEAEIMAPKPLPGLPPMQAFPALPQYSGVMGYGQVMPPVPQLAQQRYAAPPGAEAPKQLPPGPVPEQSPSSETLPPPPAAEPLSSIPAPFVILPDVKSDEPKPELMKLPPAPTSMVQVPRIFVPPMAGTPASIPAAPPPGTPPVTSTTPAKPPQSPTVKSVKEGDKYSFTRSVPAKASKAPPPETPDPKKAPRVPAPGKPTQSKASIVTESPSTEGSTPAPVKPTPSKASAVTEPQSTEGSTPAPEENVLDSLSKLLEEMPANLPGSEPPTEPPKP